MSPELLACRAMHGMVLVGNPEPFKQTRTTRVWASVIVQLEEASEVSAALPIRCKKHPDEALLVHAPEDFRRLAADGGCSRPCSFVKPCGHVCPRRCALYTCSTAIWPC